MDMDVAFYIDRLNGYANVFQTADLNVGMRLEAFEEGNLCLVIGDPLSGPPDYCRCILLPCPRVVGRWHSLQIRFEEGVARLVLDGVRQPPVPNLTKVAASRLVLGNGCCGNRPLLGKASFVRLRMEKGIPRTRPRPEKRAIRAVQGLAVLVNLFILALLVKAVRGDVRDEEGTGGTAVRAALRVDHGGVAAPPDEEQLKCSGASPFPRVAGRSDDRTPIQQSDRANDPRAA
jgi:hypothetical protein